MKFIKDMFKKDCKYRAFLKRNWKIVLLSSGIAASTIVLITTSVTLHKERKDRIPTTSPFNPSFVANGGNINTSQYLTLDDFHLTVNTKKNDISKKSAGDFAYPDTIGRNYISNQTDPDNYWTNQFIIKSLSDTDKDFFLRTKNQAPLNIFKHDYTINIQSFANEAEGILYIKIDLTPKKEVEKILAKQSKIYTITGFKKTADFQQRLANTVLSTLFLTQKFVDLNSYEGLKKAYDDTPVDQKAQFINDSIQYAIQDNFGVLDKTASTLEFNDQNKTVALKYKIKLYSYAATPDNLTAKKLVDFGNSNNMSIEVPLNVYKIKSLLPTLKFRPTQNRKFSDLTEKDITWNPIENKYNNIEMYSTDSTVNLNDYQIDYTSTSTPPGANNKDNLTFNFQIKSRDDIQKGISYYVTSDIVVPKSELKKA